MATLQERIAAKQKQVSGGSYSNFEKIPDGKSRFRILPHWSDPEDIPAQDFGKHFVRDATGSVKATYICLAKTRGEECPICSTIYQAESLTSDESVLATLKDAKASLRFIVNALPYDAGKKGHKSDPVLIDMPKTVFQSLMVNAQEYAESEDINIFDLAEGYDVIINRDGKGMNTVYTLAVAPKSSPVDAGVMDKITNLDEFVDNEIARDKVSAITAVKTLAGPAGVAISALPLATVSATIVPAAEISDADLANALEDSVEADVDELDLSELDLDELDDAS
tara:strand:- start:6100 stop:6942 length:843 start_codon:yes stop_codon:yes gene_type:complete